MAGASFGHDWPLRQAGRPALRPVWTTSCTPGGTPANTATTRTSGQGYYRDAYDVTAIRDRLLSPARPHGSGRGALCAHDPLTGVDHRHTVVTTRGDAVLIVDSVFAFRPQYNDLWDYAACATRP